MDGSTSVPSLRRAEASEKELSKGKEQTTSSISSLSSFHNIATHDEECDRAQHTMNEAMDLQWSCLDVFATNEQGKQLQILHSVSGTARVGEVCALLGPSGSGKTTLFRTITGRLKDINVHGELSLGGHPITKAAVRRIGYVPQDSMLFESLTVWESVFYAARLRLPESIPLSEKRKAAADAIRSLGLERCQHVVIGGNDKNGISGGEKKRTSIATELVGRPSILVMDEPTSGLDANIALRVVQSIRQLAETQRLCVIMSVHQPASRIFQQFSDVLVLSRGRVFIRGAPSTLAPQLAKRGHKLPYEISLPDFVLDLACGDFYEENSKRNAEEELQRLLQVQETEDQTHRGIRTSDVHLKQNGEVTQDPGGQLVVKPPLSWAWPSTWLNEFYVLTLRALKARSEKFLDPPFLIQITAVPTICALLWARKGYHSSPMNVRDTTGFLFFEVIFTSFVALFAATTSFPAERAIVAFERKGGWYRQLPYYMSRTVVDVLLNMLSPTIFVLITYFSIGLKTQASAFFKHYFIVLENALTAASLGLMCAALLMDQKKALTLATVLMLSSLLAGGFYVEEPSRFMLWFFSATYLGYSYGAVLKVQYPPGSEGYQYLPEPAQGRSIGFEVGILMVFLVGLRIIAFIALRRTIRL